MAKFQGWKKRYSYLDDYKPGLDGKYVYYGRHYILTPESGSWKNFRLQTAGAAVIALALLIVTGLLEAGSFWRMWYTNLTYGLKVIAAFLIIWKTLTLITEKYPVKQYIYKKSVPWYKPCAVIICATGFLAAAGALVCIVQNPEGMILSGCILELVMNLMTGGLGILMIKILGRYEWVPDPSEETE